MIHNEKPDRVPVAAWSHKPMIERDPVVYPRYLKEYYQSTGLDIVKLQPNQFHFIEDFDCEIEWKNARNSYHTVKRYPINDISDWDHIKYISGTSGALGREIELAKKMVDCFGQERPVVATVMDPLAMASEMSGGFARPAMVLAQMRNHPEKMEKVLDRLTDITLNYCDGLVQAGVSGIFLGDQFATTDLMTVEEHARFVRKYDLRILNHIKDRTWFNIVHVHGTQNLMMDEVLDYPVQAVSWEDLVSGVSLGDYRAKTDKILMGGIDRRMDLASCDRNQILPVLKKRMEEAYRQAGDRLIFAPGCTVPMNMENYIGACLREAADDYFGICPAE